MIGKKVLNMFIVWCMLASLVSFGWVPNQVVPEVLQTGEAQAAAPTVNIGDYIQFGSYYEQPILWRVIHIDANGNPVLFADKILTLKAFDAKGSYHTGNVNRVSYGSNYYPDSNIRQWLNSSSPNSGADTIDWIQNDPSAANMVNGNNPYNTEKGFLADGNFTSTERGLIKPLTHKVLLAGVDAGKKDGGTANYIFGGTLSTLVQNYDTTAYYKNVTDNVFLLSVKQLKEWVYDNRTALGSTYHIAKPTAQAVMNSTNKNADLINTNSRWNYWLNSPNVVFSHNVRGVFFEEIVSNYIAGDDAFGVRPALQLDLYFANFTSGSGTSASPYVVTANQTPTDISLSASSIAENSASGTTIGTMKTNIVDNSATFTLVSGTGDTDNASFAIDGMTLKTTASFDYETKSSYSILVRVTDGASATFDKQFNVNVTDVIELDIGDYIQFGKYNNAQILWRVIHKDPTTGNPILLADRILTIKAFDAKGDYHPAGDRRDYGSSFYEDSNIRQWLNSSSVNSGDNTIDWIQNDPSVANMRYGYNSYNNEKGFLADGNFTQAERDLIKPYTHKVLLSGVDYAKKDGGTENHTFDSNMATVVQNYDSAYYQNVTDNIFLLSVKQVKEWVYDNSETLGTNYHTAKPTAEAVTQSTFKEATYLKNNLNWSYWLNSPYAEYDTSVLVRLVTIDGSPVHFDYPAVDIHGVRPALSLDLLSYILKSGSGTSTNPYSLNDLTLSGIEVSTDNKTICVYSDADLNTATTDTSKITLTANGKAVATSKITATVEGKRTLKIVSTTALSGTNNKLALGVGVVKSVGTNKNNTALAETALTISPKFPTKLKSTTAGSDNKSVALELDVTGLTSPSIATSSLYDSLKSAVKIATDGKTYVALGDNDTVGYDNETKKMTVTFENALTSTKAKIQVAAGALALTPPNANNKILSPAFTSTVIDLVPQVVSTSLSADNKTVTVKYSETIVNASSLTDKTAAAAALKANVTFAANGDNFASLTNDDTVSIAKDSLVIVFKTPLGGTSSKVKIAAQAVQDGKKNKASEYTTPAITADETPPSVVGVGYAAKKLTVFFNENIILNAASLKALAGSLKYATTSSFTSPTVTIAKNVLTINSTSITSAGAITNVIIPADAVKDAASNKNLEITTSAADGTGPTAPSTLTTIPGLSNAGKDVTLTFSENIFSAAAKIPVGNISITIGTLTKPISDASLKTSTTAVTIVDGNKLKISNLKVALVAGNKITVNAGTLTDLVLNKNLAVDVTLQSDTTAPVLSTAYIADYLDTSGIFAFTSSEGGTYHTLLQGAEVAPPDAAQVKAQGILNGNPAVIGSNTFLVNNLVASTNYKLYLVVTDAANNDSDVMTYMFTGW